MAEAKKERVKWVDAITRMIELTQQGKMTWSSIEPTGTAAEEKNRTSAVFRTVYNGKALRLYERKVAEKRLINPEEAQPFRLFHFGDLKYETVWIREIVLEFIDSEGATLWTFPKIGALRDLLTAVQYQAAGVGEFLNDLFSGETNAA